jgi:putative ABC transport system permease protein
VVLQGLAVVAVGAALGVGSTFLTTKLVSSVLFGVSATDPATVITVPVLLMTAALLTCVMPALRAVRVDPVEVLKES